MRATSPFNDGTGSGGRHNNILQREWKLILSLEIGQEPGQVYFLFLIS